MLRGKGWASTLSRWTCSRKASTRCCCTLRGWGEFPNTHRAKARATLLIHMKVAQTGPSIWWANWCAIKRPIKWPILWAVWWAVWWAFLLAWSWNYSCNLCTLPDSYSGVEILPALFARIHIHSLVLKFFLHSSNDSTFIFLSYNFSCTPLALPHS